MFITVILHISRLHTFSWHGTDPHNKTRKLPGLLKFTKLKVIPDQFYYNVGIISVSVIEILKLMN